MYVAQPGGGNRGQLGLRHTSNTFKKKWQGCSTFKSRICGMAAHNTLSTPRSLDAYMWAFLYRSFYPSLPWYTSVYELCYPWYYMFVGSTRNGGFTS